MTERVTWIRIRGDLSDLKAKLAAGGQSVKSFADQTTAASKESAKWRKGLDDVATSGRNVALVAGAALAAATIKAANFDAAMSNVEAATHESARAMEDLRQAALDAGADTAFSATEAAGAIENLAKAGLSTKDILGGGLDGALSLAAAGSIEVADAAEIAATALTQFGLSGSDIPHVADLLAAGAGKAQGEVSDLSFALKQSGLVAAQMGVSIEETTGTLAAFASAGLLGSDAGTSFRTMLLRLANPSKDAADEMARLGIAAYDAQGNFVGIESLAGQLQTAFEGQSQATRDAALATIFGSDAIRAANVLYNQGAQGVADWTDKVNDAGFAAETAAIKQDNLRGDVEKLTGALETLLITGGEGSQGFLRGATQNLTEFVDALAGLPAPVKNTVTNLLAITAITGGALWFGSKVVQGVANTRQALENLGSTAEGARGKLSAVGKGVSFIGLLTALNELDKAFDDTFNRTLDGTNLDRSLSALASGRVTGELAKTFGKDLEDFGDQVIKANQFGRKLVGIVPDVLAGKTADAVNNIRDLDQALAGLVESGEQDQAAAIFDRLAEAAAESGISVKELEGRFEQYTVALDNANPVTGFFTNAIGAVTGALGTLTPATKTQVLAQQEMTEELAASRDAARDSAEAFVGFDDSLDDNKVSLSGWIKNMEEAAAALRDFRINAQTAAKRGLRDGLIAELEAAGPAGAMRMKQLAEATDAEIKRANQAWKAGQREVEKYTNLVGGVPAKATTEVELNTIPALRALDVFISQASGRRVVVGLGVNAGVARAEGGPVYGPGTATSDSIPAYLSNGEYVIRAAAVAKYGTHMFDRLNAMHLASGGPVGYAGGGIVTPPPPGASSTLMPETIKALIREFGSLAKAAKALTAEVRESESAVDRERAKRDALVSQRDAVSSAIQSRFTSDIFAKGSPWAKAATDPLSILQGDIDDLKSLSAATATLSAKGLTGATLAELLSKGDLSTVQGFAGKSPEELAQIQQKFQERTQLLSSVGLAGGNAAFGADIAAQTRVLEDTQQVNRETNRRLDKIEKVLDHANKQRDKAPEKTSEGVSKAINGAGRQAKRNKRR